MTYLEAFPEYKDETLPKEVEKWEDISFRNDLCPSWHVTDGPRHYQVWIDREDPDDREDNLMTHYGVDLITHEGDWIKELYSGDDWDEVLKIVG